MKKVERQPVSQKSGLAIKENDKIKIGLNIELSDELKLEGAARELERQVQDLRKKSGLRVGDLVDVYYNTTGRAFGKRPAQFV